MAHKRLSLIRRRQNHALYDMDRIKGDKNPAKFAELECPDKRSLGCGISTSSYILKLMLGFTILACAGLFANETFVKPKKEKLPTKTNDLKSEIGQELADILTRSTKAIERHAQLSLEAQKQLTQLIDQEKCDLNNAKSDKLQEYLKNLRQINNNFEKEVKYLEKVKEVVKKGCSL
ncbi:hypothetical protein M1446_02755 [Candidatus Dependentiae bacterium]|nr:hypothetical protein [Candidatus Dependentiae bacterium]